MAFGYNRPARSRISDCPTRGSCWTALGSLMSTRAAIWALCSAAVVWLQATATESPYTATTGKLAATPGSLSTLSRPKLRPLSADRRARDPWHVAQPIVPDDIHSSCRRQRQLYVRGRARSPVAIGWAGECLPCRRIGHSTRPPRLPSRPPGHMNPRPGRPPGARAPRAGSQDRPSHPAGAAPAGPGLPPSEDRVTTTSRTSSGRIARQAT